MREKIPVSLGLPVPGTIKDVLEQLHDRKASEIVAIALGQRDETLWPFS